ncbi:MAG: MarR family winged helix-turn-helix transcriptional regulator [Actinomycetota bacterium]
MDGLNSQRIGDELGFLLARLGTATRLKLGDAVAPLDLTLRQFLVLRAVAGSEGLSQAQLCERLRIDASSMVQVIDDCSGRGLVERRPSIDDRRRYAIHLTPRGRNALRRAGRVVQKVQRELFTPLSEEQQGNLLELLFTLAAHGPLAQPAAAPSRKAASGL